MGFKSFADKTVIQFEPGVTAVVGPNGSGKSNISDSIRWVLGEQSAKSLRGGKMEDIIFAGTSNRKPLNFAEVTLVLDNSCESLAIGFEEVSITRRVYRTRESEYLINKQKVRLKDVVDLMMDTGIGHDSLSIISQDRVKGIVESRVEDRRGIIEEAAGVLKYKTRKKEATRKLLATQDNLTRVHDIIFELEGQVEPLRLQADRAEKYVALKAEASQSEISVLAYDVKTLNDQLKQAKQNKQEFEIQHLSISSKINTDEQQRNKLKESKEQQEMALENLQNQLVEISETIQKLQGQRDVLKERLKNTSSNQDQLTNQQAQLQVSLDSKENELKATNTAVKEIKTQLNQKQNQLSEVSKEYHHLEENLKKQLEVTRNEHFANLSELSNVKNQYLTIGEQLQLVEAEYKQLQLDKDQLTVEQEQFDKEEAEFNQKYSQQETNLKEKHKENQNFQRLYQQQQKTAEMEAERYRQLVHQQDKLNSRLQWLTEAQKDFAGFNDGVKRILKAREQRELSGIEGAVAELVTIPKELELAMDVVLGPTMQQIVTTSDESAKVAIQYLKRNRAGRATFLPLNVIKSRQLPAQVQQQLQKMDQVVGVASQLVQYDKRYTQIFENLLGSIIITKHLDAANQLAKQLQYRYRIVTLDGDVVNTGGAMTGGAIKRQGSSLLRQKNEIEDCKEQIKTLEIATKESIELQENYQTELKTMEQQLAKLEAAGERLKTKLNEQNQEKVAFNYRRQIFTQRATALKQAEVNYLAEIKKFAKQNNDLADKRILLEERIESAKKMITDLEAQLARQEEFKSVLLQQMTDLKIEVARLETQLQNQITTCERLEEEVTQVNQQLEEVKERLASSEIELTGSDDEVEKLEVAASQMSENREQIIQDIQGRRLQLTKVNSELETLEREVRESRKTHQRLTESINREAVAIGKMDVELDVMIKKIEEEHEMTFTYAADNYPLKGAVSEIKEKIRQLKVKMSALGEVNTGAIQEYQRIKERFDFLSEQRDDLVRAKTNLEETIHEMDQEMIVKFKETFNQVRVHYIEIFKKLFGGGNADLMLTDPHDLLNTGVEIIAQPPGTNLKTSNLLSGGQKALTSIALLFAILKVRTVPFCVLDEVEAALDEANVARYANYLKLFSEETQFIVITHRKGTMENADVLYGVTMQERGVTKLVSVRMENVSQYLDNESA